MVDPRLWSIGLSQFLVNTFTIFYYITLVPYVLSYFFDSFINPLPWKVEESETSQFKKDVWNRDYFE
jgi:SNF family Na+-dependent transporter